jgi:hypothetical protein
MPFRVRVYDQGGRVQRGPMDRGPGAAGEILKAFGCPIHPSQRQPNPGVYWGNGEELGNDGN